MIYTDIEKSKLSWYNWNRTAQLFNMSSRNAAQQSELNDRISLNNSYAFAEDGSEEEIEILNLIEASLTPAIIKSVHKYMRTSKNVARLTN